MRLPPLIYNAIGKFLLYVILTVSGIVLIADNGIVQRYRIMEVVRSFQSFFWEQSMEMRNYTRLKEINLSLTRQNAQLLKQNIAYRNYIMKSRGENSLAELTARILANKEDSALVKFDFAIAKVVKNSSCTEHNYLIIDKGTNDGITEDMGVITPNGVIGITRAVGPDCSYVFSFLNEKQSISARIGNTDAFGILRWNSLSPRTATLSEIPLSVAVKKGDIVYTSGFSSFYPADIPIGKAVSCRTSSGSSQEVTVRLLQNYNNLSYVIIAKNHNKKGIDSLLLQIHPESEE